MINDIINRVNNDNGFIGNNNFKIIKLTDNESIIECEIKETGLNSMGIAHGGLLFGLADTAAGTLAFTTGRKCVTSSANINYLKPANGKITATATILKEGKNMGYYYVEIKNDKNELVATSLVNMFFIS